MLPTNFFDDLGYDYLGPINGHNLKELINILEIAKIDPDPVFIHLKTVKGKGYEFAEKNPESAEADSGKQQINMLFRISD